MLRLTLAMQEPNAQNGGALLSDESDNAPDMSDSVLKQVDGMLRLTLAMQEPRAQSYCRKHLVSCLKFHTRSNYVMHTQDDSCTYVRNKSTRRLPH